MFIEERTRSSRGRKLDPKVVEALRSVFHGELIQPGMPGYDEARKVWNGMIDRYPALIARCKDDSDVIQAVNFGRSLNLLVAVRGGGHNVAGFGTCDDGLVIDLSGMKKITVDLKSGTVQAQAGLTWGEFDRATQAHGLATTGGLVSTTGVSGFTLGGGIGWLMRKYGLALDNLLAVKIVTADGTRQSASATENSDLFWGIRGGGGNFGIVTEFTFQLHPIGPTIFGGAVLYGIDKARQVLRFHRQWTASMPDELTTQVAFLTAPPAPFVPPALVGAPMIAVAMCCAGEAEDGEMLAKPLLELTPPEINLLGPMPYLALQGMFDATAPRGALSYWKTQYLHELDDATIDMLIAQAAKMRSPMSAMHIHHLQGAVSRVPEGGTAFAHRDSPFLVNIIGIWTDPGHTDANVAWARDTWQALQPFSTGAEYLNFLGGDEGKPGLQAAYGDQKYARLVELKQRYDPTNLFRVNQNIPPMER
jgi:hypothetical protein